MDNLEIDENFLRFCEAYKDKHEPTHRLSKQYLPYANDQHPRRDLHPSGGLP